MKKSASIKILVLIIAIFSISSCTESESYSECIKKMNAYISGNEDSVQFRDIKYIVIIPEQGCSGCLSVAEAFYKDYSSREDILFVFSNVMSYKMLHNKLKINACNTIIDSSNTYLSMLPRKNRMYPNVIMMKEGYASAMVSQSTKEFGLRALRRYLENTNP